MSWLDLFTPRPERRHITDTEVYSTSTLSDPADWLIESLGEGGRQWTGEVLTKKGAEALPAVWACKRVLENGVALLPLNGFRRLPGGGRERADDEIQHQLVRVRPNPFQTPMQFKAMLMFHVLSYGDAYCEIERATPGDVRSPPVALWPLLSDRTRCKMFEGVKICETRIRDENGGYRPQVLLPGEYCHIPGTGFDGLRGYSPLVVGSQSIAVGLAQLEHIGRFYDGDAMTSQWVTVPQIQAGVQGAMKQKMKTIRDWIRSEHGGLRRSHRMGILWEGAQLQKGVATPEEQQQVESRNLSGYDVCRLFNVKPHKVALMDRATFTNIESQDLNHMGDSIMPWSERIREVFDWELWPEERRSTRFFACNYKAMLRSTPKDEAETIKIGVTHGWISRAEARQIQDMNPAPENQGLSDFLAPVNLVPSRIFAEMSGEPEQSPDGQRARAVFRRMLGLEPPAAAPRVASAENVETRQLRSASVRNRLRIAHLPVFTRAAERWISAEVAALRRLLDRHGEDLAAFTQAAGRYFEQLPEAILRELGPAMETFGKVIVAAIEEELDATVAGPAYDVAVGGVAAAGAARHIRKSRGALAGVISDHAGSAPAAVEALGLRFDAWLENRAPKVAASESVRAGGRLAQEAYAAGGIREKRWVAFGGCPLCTSIDGRVVGISGVFFEPGDTVDPEAEGVEPLTVDRQTFHPPLHGGCSCAITSA